LLRHRGTRQEGTRATRCLDNHKETSFSKRELPRADHSALLRTADGLRDASEAAFRRGYAVLLTGCATMEFLLGQFD
jgi:hypothetical protein